MKKLIEAEIKLITEERTKLNQRSAQLQQEQNQITTRIVEIQGATRSLQSILEKWKKAEEERKKKEANDGSETV
ncbi:hypothetical protein LCGC14_1420640 [marine sediment metagenome]|uniref:Uncharacterized protein n=1 Tax=marine sediment metagenome TaxID=412755 RepID=A0A0F9JRZ6_9ZZZZ